MEIFKAQSNNAIAKFTFYAFEIIAFVYFFVTFILSIVFAVQAGSFAGFIEGLLQAIFNSCVLYGIGRIIDFIAVKNNN